MDTRALRDVAFSEFKLLLSRIHKKVLPDLGLFTTPSGQEILETFTETFR